MNGLLEQMRNRRDGVPIGRRVVLVLAACMVTAAQAQAADADYPSKTITLVVPFTVGGGSDTIARLVAARITEKTGKTIIIDNRGGAGTNIGNELVARSAPDGYTYLLGQFAIAVNPALYENLRYSIDKDFASVVHIADSPAILVVGSNSPIVDVKSLLERIKSKPDSSNYGSGGNGTPPHLSTELFQKITGTKLTHIPYKGSGPAMMDVIAGRLDLIIDSSTAVLSQVKGGRLRALAVAGPRRLSELPNVPTFAEAGVKGMEVPVWYGLLVPKGTPDYAVKWMNGQVNEVLKDPVFVAKLDEFGAQPVGGTPAEFSAFIQAQARRWATVVKDSNIKIE